MTQRDVYEALSRLGGKATWKEIRSALPPSDHTDRLTELRKLCEWGYVRKELPVQAGAEPVYEVLEPYPPPNDGRGSPPVSATLHPNVLKRLDREKNPKDTALIDRLEKYELDG